MLKTVVIVIVAAIPLVFGAAEVKAQYGNASGGVQCPVGTCNPAGGHRASDMKYCKPSNCKKDSVR
jgi:hypothetical protein